MTAPDTTPAGPAATFHLDCLFNGWAFDGPFDGLGVIFRSHQPIAA
jgi:hypothetical protein